MNEPSVSVVDALTKLADKIGQTVDHLWPQAIRYVVIGSCVDIFIALTLTYSAYWLWKKGLTLKDSYMESEFKTLLMVLNFIAICILLIVALVHFTSISSLIEPEGYLVREILKGAKGG